MNKNWLELNCCAAAERWTGNNGLRAGISINTFSCKLGRKACPKPSIGIGTGSAAASSVRVFGLSIEKFKNSATCEERYMFIKALCTFDCVHLVSSNYGQQGKRNLEGLARQYTNRCIRKWGTSFLSKVTIRLKICLCSDIFFRQIHIRPKFLSGNISAGCTGPATAMYAALLTLTKIFCRVVINIQLWQKIWLCILTLWKNICFRIWAFSQL